jgi:hypothetical protein
MHLRSALKEQGVINAFPVLLALASHMHTEEGTGVAFPGMPLLASESGLSKSTIVRGVELLESHGFIKVERVSKNSVNRYHTTELWQFATPFDGKPQAEPVSTPEPTPEPTPKAEPTVPEEFAKPSPAFASPSYEVLSKGTGIPVDELKSTSKGTSEDEFCKRSMTLCSLGIGISGKIPKWADGFNGSVYWRCVNDMHILTASHPVWGLPDAEAKIRPMIVHLLARDGEKYRESLHRLDAKTLQHVAESKSMAAYLSKVLAL